MHIQRNLRDPPLDPLPDQPLDLAYIALCGIGFGADAEGVFLGRRDGVHQSISMVLKGLDPTIYPALDQVRSLQSFVFDQVFDPPLREDQIVSESRRSLVPRRLGRGGSVDESRQISSFAGSKNILMVEKSGWPVFDRVTGRNARITMLASKRKANSTGNIWITGSDRVSPDMKIVPE